VRFLKNRSDERLPIEGMVLEPGAVVAVEGAARVSAMLHHKAIEDSDEEALAACGKQKARQVRRERRRETIEEGEIQEGEE